MDNLIRAQEWRKLAEMDLASAEYLIRMHPIPIEIICYHCQQSADKYLKCYLVLRGMNPPKTHDLNETRRLSLALSDSFEGIADHCSDLNAFGVQPRYPMELVLEEQDMREALDSARAIRDAVLRVAPEVARTEYS